MPIPVWLPYALKGGSMVASGIGNYLEGKNQESYSKRVMRMQQEASAKRQKAEGAAGAANIWFGLAGRQQMQPLYQKMPDIDPYESSGVGSLFKGLGTGLSYASTAVSAYDSMSKLMAEQAREAGAREGASKYIDAVSKSSPAVTTASEVPSAMFYDNLTQYTGGEAGLLDQSLAVGTQAIDDSVSHSTQVLSHLLDQNAEIQIPEYKGILGLGGAQEKAYLEGYKTSLGATVEREQGKLLQSQLRAMQRATHAAEFERSARFDEAQLLLKQEMFDWEKLQATKAGKISVQEAVDKMDKGRRDIQGVFTAYFDESEQIAKIKETEELIALAHNTPGINLIQDEVTKRMKFKLDPNAKFGGGQMYTFLGRYMRWVSNEAIHEGDIARLNEISMSLGQAASVKWDNLKTSGIIELFTGEEVLLDDVLKNPRMFDNGTIENMLNTALGQTQYLKDSVREEIKNRVAFQATGWQNSFNTLGFTDTEDFTNFFAPNLERLYGLEAVKAVSNPMQEGDFTNTIFSIVKPDDVPGIDTAITRGAVTPLEREFNARIIAGKSALKKQIGGRRRSLTGAQSEAFHRDFPGMPTTLDDPFWDVEDLSQPAVKALKKGRRGHGYQLYAQPRSEEEIALSFLIHNNGADARAAWMKNAEIANNFTEFQQRDKSNARTAISGLQNAIGSANNAWGRGVSAPRLRDPNLITDYMAPGSRVQNAVEGQAGLAGFFGVGGLYTDTRNITRVGYPTLTEKYAQKRPWLSSATLDAARQFQRGGQPIHRYSRPITPSAFRGR
tara:strand:- start:3252 stop:5603 length:2352 start_codon:yes stop_codon:yes gene_type:complete